MAKDAAAKRKNQIARWSSIIHVIWNINKTLKSEILSWHNTRNEEQESQNRSYHISRLKSGIDPVLEKVTRKYLSHFFQLKVGHKAVGVFLEKIGSVKIVEY